MSINSTKKKRSSCGKIVQLMRSFLELPSFPLTETDVRSSTSLSPPRNHHRIVKNQIIKPPNSRHVDGLDGDGTSSFIKIQGMADDTSSFGGMQTTELKASVTNLKASDYIRRFHERNKHESVSLVLTSLPPPPPPPPPSLPLQGRFLLK